MLEAGSWESEVKVENWSFGVAGSELGVGSLELGVES